MQGTVKHKVEVPFCGPFGFRGLGMRKELSLIWARDSCSFFGAGGLPFGCRGTCRFSSRTFEDLHVFLVVQPRDDVCHVLPAADASRQTGESDGVVN